MSQDETPANLADLCRRHFGITLQQKKNELVLHVNRKKSQKLSVLKFGGSSLATPEKIQAVAERIAALARDGRKLVVVVSAMGQTTDELLNLARRVSPHPNRRELDMLLTTGERVSMALMSMALHDRGCPSISFTGSQAGVMTNGSFSNADIIDIRPIRVAEELRKNRVVVLAGFQGVNPKTKEITTLGRGGSDTTAIAMASALGAARCEIYKDVDGVFGADPKVNPQAPFYEKIPLELLHEFCHWGAKILHVHSIEWAMKGQVPIAIGRSSDFKLGTMVSASSRPKPDELRPIVGLHSHAHVLELFIQRSGQMTTEQRLALELNPHDLPVPKILHIEKFKDGARAFVTLDKDTLAQIQHRLEASKRTQVVRDDLSSIALTIGQRPKSGQLRNHEAPNYLNGLEICRFTSRWSEVSIVPSEERLEALRTIGNSVF